MIPCSLFISHFINLLMDVWVASTSWLLFIMLQQMCKSYISLRLCYQFIYVNTQKLSCQSDCVMILFLILGRLSIAFHSSYTILHSHWKSTKSQFLNFLNIILLQKCSKIFLQWTSWYVGDGVLTFCISIFSICRIIYNPSVPNYIVLVYLKIDFFF